MISITWLLETNSFDKNPNLPHHFGKEQHPLASFALRNFTHWLDKTAGSQPAPMNSRSSNVFDERNTLTRCPTMASHSLFQKKIVSGHPHVAGQHLAKNYRPSLRTCLPASDQTPIIDRVMNRRKWPGESPLVDLFMHLVEGNMKWKFHKAIVPRWQSGVAFLEPCQFHSWRQ